MALTRLAFSLISLTALSKAGCTNASKLAGAGKTYPEDYLKEIGYLKDKPKAKKSEKKVENKAVKPKDVEDK